MALICKSGNCRTFCERSPIAYQAANEIQASHGQIAIGAGGKAASKIPAQIPAISTGDPCQLIQGHHLVQIVVDVFTGQVS
ncbi:hypothetical protein RB25_03310 [Herbaspirillum rubrisubalbicans]|uniref:PAAR domain-containing protein n=1 Tax=Herbaspirillum rubrisubalbicans TaxID=80842 RepID=A0ABX9C2H1_9BURK|nr:hypothetical protein RB24_10710 [Herbaspirillum rubrisubalbicans]RAN49893.1 hypothetical protein RB25_03310 [Herbaspirillum rubrisubalbicans]